MRVDGRAGTDGDRRVMRLGLLCVCVIYDP